MTTPPPKPIKPASNPAAPPETVPKRTNQKVLIVLYRMEPQGRPTDRAMLRTSREVWLVNPTGGTSDLRPNPWHPVTRPRPSAAGTWGDPRQLCLRAQVRIKVV